MPKSFMIIFSFCNAGSHYGKVLRYRTFLRYHPCSCPFCGLLLNRQGLKLCSFLSRMQLQCVLKFEPIIISTSKVFVRCHIEVRISRWDLPWIIMETQPSEVRVLRYTSFGTVPPNRCCQSCACLIEGVLYMIFRNVVTFVVKSHL